MFGKKKSKKAPAEPVVELTPFQKAAQERAEMKPFENSLSGILPMRLFYCCYGMTRSLLHIRWTKE